MDPLSPFCLSLCGLLLAFSLPPGAEASQCPRGWLAFRNICFGFFDMKMTWKEAELACQDYGETSHLASISSKEETTALSKHIQGGYSGSNPIWVGLYEINIGTLWKREFRWADLSTISYMAWGPGEPNDPQENCAVLQAPEYKKWSDYRCDSKFPFMCKYYVN